MSGRACAVFLSPQGGSLADTDTLDRTQLLDDIRVLTSLLQRAERHEERVDTAEDRDAHIGAQVTRLEEAALKIERRLLALDADEEVVGASERQTLNARLTGLNEKIVSLTRAAASNEVLDASAYAARPPAVPARLRRTLHALVRDLHADPTASRADVRPFQRHLAELVRGRRDELERVVGRLVDARGYVLSAADSAAYVRSAAADMEGPTVQLPFEDERRAAATRIEMARAALREAHSELCDLAHDWPELKSLADRPDWRKIPFAQAHDLLLPRDEQAASRVPAALRLEEAHTMLSAMALWVEEIRSWVAAAPPPT